MNFRAFFILSIVACLLASTRADDDKDASSDAAESNGMIDVMIKSAIEHYRHEIEPLALPNKTIGNIDLKKGYLSGLSTLARSGDATMGENEQGTWVMRTRLTAGVLNVSYDFNVHLFYYFHKSFTLRGVIGLVEPEVVMSQTDGSKILSNLMR